MVGAVVETAGGEGVEVVKGVVVERGEEGVVAGRVVMEMVVVKGVRGEAGGVREEV
jgi:hypothetical protein